MAELAYATVSEAVIVVGSSPTSPTIWASGGIGIRSGLKIRYRCGFKPHLAYHIPCRGRINTGSERL